jgi:hypothetical protein
VRRAVAATALLALAACSRQEPNYGTVANKIGEMGKVPRAVKLIAAEILTKCKVPPDGRFIFFHWESSPGSPPGALYSLELSHDQIRDATKRRCLEAQIKTLGMDSELDLGEEPSPPEHIE